MVSSIAYAPWFYDSGRLFWIFEPNTVVPSDRARWPFVNSNSLAQFLCLPLMLLIGLMIERWQKRSLKLLPRNLSQLSYTLGGKSSQKRLAVGIALVLSCLSMSLAFISTLSRAGWLGLSLGLLCLVVTQVLSSDKSKAIEQTVPSARKLGVRRQRRLRRSRSADRDQNYLERGYQHILRFAQRPSKLFQITALIIVLALVLGFLGNRGRELVQGRVEYGLAHSKDDIRLTLYQDSVRMIEDYPIFGVGLAGWGDVFPRYMSDPLAGMNPVYAHSEPLQLQAEGGLVGSLIVISFLIATLTHMFRAIMRRSKHRAVLIGLLSGWVALLTTALLDFPFRIPATNFYVAIVLALTTFYIDRSLKEPVQAD